MNIPKLKPSTRSREHNSYSQQIRDKVIYAYLFEGRSHRRLDKEIINIDASRGWQSMGILHYLGMKNDFKGLFQDISIEEAIDELKNLNNKEYDSIIEALERYKRQNENITNINEVGHIGEKVEKYDIKDKTLRAVNAATIAKYDPEDEEDETAVVDLTQGIQTRKVRTKRHNELVTDFAIVLENKGLALFEGRIDCLGVKEEQIGIISEIKTLNGSLKDEGSQVMRAIGQLYYYEECEMYQYTGIKTQKVVVFEKRISDKHVQLLRNCNILTFWKEQQGITGTEEAVQFLENL